MERKSPSKRKGRRKDDIQISGRLESVELEDLIPPQEPLLNVFTFGWMEDGRLGYDADDTSFIQSVPRPMASLRAAPPKKKAHPISDSTSKKGSIMRRFRAICAP